MRTKSQIGKANRAAGSRFEAKVRDSKGRFVKGHIQLGDNLKAALEYNKKHGVWNKDKKIGKSSKEVREKQSITMKKRWKEDRPLTAQERKIKISNTLKGHSVSNKTRNKIRKSISKHVEKVGGPRLGKHETQILDELELLIESPIIRQFPVKGYFVDGYDKQNNIVFEVDEKPKIKDKDLYRENLIKNELNCEFMRIPTW